MIAQLLAPALPWAVLSIAAPLAAGLLAVPLGRRAALAYGIVIPAGLALAALCAGQVLQHGPQSLALGGWPAPLGIELRLDGLAAAFLCLNAVVGAGAALYALRYFRIGDRTLRPGFSFHTQFLLLWAALNGLALSADLFNLYVALELITISAVAMVALSGQAQVIAAAIRYLLFALFGSLAYLTGVVLVYGAYGTMDMRLVGEAAGPDWPTWVAAALMTAGLLAKTALFPLHAWLPPAHAGAPAPASALLSALVVKAGFYVVLRLWFDVFADLSTDAVTALLATLGAGAVLYGSWQALRQERLKPIVAYSTVAQLGYLFLVFPLAGGASEVQPWNAGAWSGAVFHALAHGLAKAAMFLAAGALLLAARGDTLADLKGLARRAPIAVAAFGLAALSLMGLPPSGGFLGKYLVLTAAVGAGAWWWAAVPVAGGLLSAAYLFRALNCMFQNAADDAPPLERAPLLMQAIPFVLALAASALGVFSLWPYALIQIGVGPEAVEGLP